MRNSEPSAIVFRGATVCDRIEEFYIRYDMGAACILPRMEISRNIRFRRSWRETQSGVRVTLRKLTLFETVGRMKNLSNCQTALRSSPETLELRLRGAL